LALLSLAIRDPIPMWQALHRAYRTSGGDGLDDPAQAAEFNAPCRFDHVLCPQAFVTSILSPGQPGFHVATMLRTLMGAEEREGKVGAAQLKVG
jgi:hypothetical protein